MDSNYLLTYDYYNSFHLGIYIILEVVKKI